MWRSFATLLLPLLPLLERMPHSARCRGLRLRLWDGARTGERPSAGLRERERRGLRERECVGEAERAGDRLRECDLLAGLRLRLRLRLSRRRSRRGLRDLL